MTNEVLSVISARRSHRAYLPDRIPEEKLTAILQAGLEAPSAVNRQPWLYTVVEDQALLQEIHNATAEGMTLRDPSARSPRFADSAFHVFYHAPAVIFIFGEKNFGWTSVDCGIAVQNMALAAESLGLGTVILGLPQAAFSTDKALKIGTPRYDFLIRNATNATLIRVLKEKYAKILGFNPSQKIIVYMPTWRSAGGKIFCFYNLSATDQSDLKRMLDTKNAVLIEKHHVHTYELYPPPTDSACSIAVKGELQSQLDTQELLLISDILITDYSSVYVDFGVIKRPTIHYMYELSGFEKSDTGIPDNFTEIAGGPLVKDLPALKQEITRLLDTPAFEPGPRFSELTKYETGHGCEQLLAFMRGASSASR